MKAKNSLQDTTKVSSYGFVGNEAKVVQALLKVCAQKLSRLEILPADRAGEANVVFVDSDRVGPKDQWPDALTSSYVSKVWVGSQVQEEGAVQVAKPLILKRLVGALETLMSTTQNKAQATATPAHRPHVLVVDDSFAVRNFMQQKIARYLGDMVGVDFAETGKEAAARVQKRGYELVFLDVVMPGVDGYKVCKWIKTHYPKCKVVMLTSKKSPIDKVRANLAGCDGFLSKPPDEEKLKSILKAMEPTSEDKGWIRDLSKSWV